MFIEWPEITDIRAKILHKNAKSKGLFRKVKFVEDMQNENYIEMVLYNG